MSESEVSYVLQIASLISISALLSFHIFRQQNHTKQNKSAKQSRQYESKIFKILDLTLISYLICIAYILETLIFSQTFTIHLITPFLTNNICNAIYRISSTFSLLGRFGVHLFVAVRCRLASHRRKLNIWSKIGLTLILSDLFIMLSVWIYSPQIVSTFNGQSCIIYSYSIIYVFWVIGNDIIISVYCLIVFVCPLRKAMHQSTDPETDDNTAQNNSIDKLIKRVVFCSSISLFGILIHCSVASTIGFDSIIAPINGFITCYMSVMQFKDTNPYTIKSKYFKLITFIFQWDYWCCCNRQMRMRNDANTLANNLKKQIVETEATSGTANFGTTINMQEIAGQNTNIKVICNVDDMKGNNLKSTEDNNNNISDSNDGIIMCDEYETYIKEDKTIQTNIDPIHIVMELTENKNKNRLQDRYASDNRDVHKLAVNKLKLDIISKSVPLFTGVKLKHGNSKVNKNVNKTQYVQFTDNNNEY
eukprot:337943_1